MPAETTNALTNALHALCLFLYFLGAVRHRRRGSDRFSESIVYLFLLLFVLKVMGVYVHYTPHSVSVKYVWGVISVGLIFLNYVMLHTIAAPIACRVGAIAFFITSSSLSLLIGADYIYLAVPLAVISFAAAHFSYSTLRLGFIASGISNLVWIGSRKITAWYLGEQVPVAYRYDNDVYHILLIISTFMIYKAVAQGDLRRTVQMNLASTG